jgi:nicotinamide riboside kinase
MEDQAARQANRILICDTNAFATRLWHRRYMGFDHEPLEKFAKGCRADLYLLTGDEIPFVQDGLRDGEHIRHEMHQWFETALSQQHVPWRHICGPAEERLNAAMKAINELLRP